MDGTIPFGQEKGMTGPKLGNGATIAQLHTLPPTVMEVDKGRKDKGFTIGYKHGLPQKARVKVQASWNREPSMKFQPTLAAMELAFLKSVLSIPLLLAPLYHLPKGRNCLERAMRR